MEKNKKKWASLVFALVAFFGALVSFGRASAAEEVDYHLGIAPTQSNLGSVQPGESYSGEFKIRNHGKKAAEYEIDFAPYSVKNESYDPVYDEQSVYTEISKWITVSTEGGTIEPGQEQVINFTVNVPADTHGGAQSAIIVVRLVQDGDDSAETSVQTVQQLGYLVFGNVDGEVTKTGKILENKVPTFLFNPPIFGTSVVENTGNVYTAAQYTLQVFPLFSDEEVYTNEEKPEDSIIFPETKRFNQIQWEGAPHLGIFKVRQTVKIFDEESVTEKVVFLCPIWFLFIVLLLIFCIIFWLVSRAFRRKKEA